MKPRTRLTPTEVAGIRAARAKGASIDDLAKQFGRSRSHIANLVRHHAELTRTAHASDTLAPVGALDVARAEFRAERPALRVESLEERLVKAVPGAVVVETTSPTRVVARFAVWVDGVRSGRVTTGVSKRDAVDKAIALYGVQR